MSFSLNDTYALITLGCFKNEVESDNIRSALSSFGMLETSTISEASIVIINTCGFIAEACEEGIDTILEVDEIISRAGERPPLVAIGCMAQRYGRELLEELPELDCVLGTDWQAKIWPAISSLLQGKSFHTAPGPPRPYTGKRTIDSSQDASLYIRIAEGCNNLCRFCTIPAIKGPYISRPADEILDEIKRLGSGRDREVILTAQEVTSWGEEFGLSIERLLPSILALPNVRWLRLLYLQPEGVTERLVHCFAANDGLCNYFDIPFQHVSRKILRAMGRTGSADEYLQLLQTIRNAIPDAAIRSTFMVGYPGEDDRDFEELLEFAAEANIDWLGGFIFSREEGTPAASLGGAVDREVAVDRYNRLVDLQDSLESRRLDRMLGRQLEVLIDEVSEIEPYEFVGRSYREAPVVDGMIYLTRTGNRQYMPKPGEFVQARVTDREGLDLVAAIRSPDEQDD